MKPQYLEPELRELVNQTVSLLGEVIRKNTGVKLYNKIELYRKEMAQLRNSSFKTKVRSLNKLYFHLKKHSPKEQFYIAHSFALMLEIMNTCENAYRTYLIQQRKPVLHEKHPQGVFFVLTAHPTESRSPQNMAIFSEMQALLVQTFHGYFEWNKDRLKSIIEMAWSTPITRQRKPEVSDEAEYIYSIVLNPLILDSLLRAHNEVTPFYLRSWVGGDKDGHPGVCNKTMLMSLTMSRQKLLSYILGLFKRMEFDLELLKVQTILVQVRKTMRSLQKLNKVKSKDGERIKQLQTQIEKLISDYSKVFGTPLPCMMDVINLLKMFPGLVVPLELRESSELITKAAKTKSLQPITGMLKSLHQISRGGQPRWYVRGLIISMCGKIEHVQSGLKLVRRFFNEPKLPVIPLFEQEAALQLSLIITSQMLRNSFIKNGIKKFWNNRLEIMLGYSDSAKEVGVLQSRLLISETVIKIERLCLKNKITPVFFHGSGGSVDRGGGSVQEQTSWLSDQSRSLFKTTIQGEMVERTFSSPLIFRSSLDHLATQLTNQRNSFSNNYYASKKSNSQISPHLKKFAAEVSKKYKQTIHSPDFLEVVQKATPYRYLSALKIGSRPSKRGKISTVLNLRAIPWVLCWTQTRILFPVWWGIGSAWNELSLVEQKKLKQDFKSNSLFRSYIKLLGFTLAKVELPVWDFYLKNSTLSAAKAEKISQLFHKEFQLSIKFVFSITGKTSLLWYRHWLGESIQLRSPMIHPLNLLQMISLEHSDPKMIRETVAGIASGMMTTG